MYIEAKTTNDQGDVLFEGKLNKREISFLLNYAINDLLAVGAVMNLQAADDPENPKLRIDLKQAKLNS